LHHFNSNILHQLYHITKLNQITAINMFGFKLFAVAALACAVVATECK